MEEEDDGNVVKAVLGALRAYLHSNLPLDKDFFNELGGRGLLASNTASELAQLAGEAKKDCVWKLITYMEKFYTEEMLLKLCDFLDEYAQPARPRLATISSRIRQEILKLKPQVPPPVPEDTLQDHRSAGVHDDKKVQYLVITPLKEEFSQLVSEVFFEIEQLNKEKMGKLHTYLSTLLEKSSVPETVDKLKKYLGVWWNELHPDLLRSIVKHLENDKLSKMMTNFQRTLAKEGSKPIGEFTVETVQLEVASEKKSLSVEMDRSPDQLTLEEVFSLRNLINSLGRRIRAIFRGFKRGCTVLFFSIPTECVWSLPSCLLPSNLSLLEEWKVLFFSVKGAFTVDINERRVVDSLDKHSLLSSLSEYKTRCDDLQTRNDDLQTRNDDLQTHNNDLQTRVRQQMEKDKMMNEQVTSGSKRSPSGDESSASKRPKSNIDSKVLLQYKSYFVSQLRSLGVALGVEDAAAILDTPASLASKYIQITDTWMRCTANPTLEKFCSCLSKCKDFTHVRTLIEQEQLGIHEEDKTELVHSTPEDIIALGLGPTGVGKSTFGNFVTDLKNSFKEGYALEPETKKVSLASLWMGDIGRWFRYMDSPGLNHDAVDDPDSLAEAIAVSSAKLAMDLRAVNLSFSVILIVTPLSVRDPSGILLMMNAMQIYDNFWDHSILLLTHANEYWPELTQEDKEKKFSDMLKSENCPKAFKSLADKVEVRLVFVESKDWRSYSHAQYRNDTLKKIVAHSDAITKTRGHYKDKLHSIGREAYDVSEMQYIKDHPEADPESQGAKDEIYRMAFLRVKSVALKAIRIQSADGVDVEKRKNIASLKDNELQRLGQEKQLMIERLIKQLRQAEMEKQRLQEIVSDLQPKLEDQKEQMAAAQKKADEKHSQVTSELKAERQRNREAQAEAQTAQAQLQQQI